ncbi:hypothetical protein [Fibrella aquatilis]|uniref:Uncharacterized protein n=1 Tax=Fibrella aquatilis TaxID=2817059 RepID=A0A939K144_9BACT|nr:hypothetical protein [Fibrella aquatilis]MBO0931885.1 hypothetical protein [Fibrella aquatilis]
MCTIFSTQTTDFWLLGTTIQQVAIEQLQGIDGHSLDTVPANFQCVNDWKAFRQEVLSKRFSCRKRVVLVCDSSVLSHEDIISIRLLREKHSWFIPVIYFDRPDLGKVIHTFNADLAGYCTATDTVDELRAMLQNVKAGKLYYSTGFRTLLQEYGFIIKENS